MPTDTLRLSEEIAYSKIKKLKMRRYKVVVFETIEYKTLFNKKITIDTVKRNKKYSAISDIKEDSIFFVKKVSLASDSTYVKTMHNGKIAYIKRKNYDIGAAIGVLVLLPALYFGIAVLSYW